MSDPSSPLCPRCGMSLDAGNVEGLCANCLGALNFATETVLPGEGGAQPAAAVPAEELAPHFPQLEILECLGRGGMGVVYKARQKALNRLVALKLLAPERAGDAAFAARFAREAQALAALNHPSIVGVYDFGQAGGFFYLLMEFVDGVNLRQGMQAGRLTPEQALAVVPPVCEALQFAHEHGIVHRDIKPENLLLDKAGRVKIADFGIAKMLGDDSTAGLADSQPAGTPQYMAPEQKEHRRTDHRADIYSLGVVLYEMLTGELPAAQLQPPSRKVQIDVRLDEIVLRALEKAPERRYQTAAEMGTQVETVVSDGRAGVQESARLPDRTSDSPQDPFLSRFALILFATGLIVPAIIYAFSGWRWPSAVVASFLVGGICLALAFVLARNSRPQVAARIVLTGVPVVLLTVAAFFVVVFFQRQSAIAAVQRQVERAVEEQRTAFARAHGARPETLEFGPSLEATIRSAFDFDTGRGGEVPRATLEGSDPSQPVLSMLAWMESEGMDVYAQAGKPGLAGYDLRVVTQPGEAWTSLSGEHAVELLVEPLRDPFPFESLDPGITYVFQTGEGSVGLLQLLGVAGEGAQVRYKLLTNSAGPTPKLPSPFARRPPVLAARTWMGEIASRVDAIGTVPAVEGAGRPVPGEAGMVVFQIPESYTQAVVKSLSAKSRLSVTARGPDGTLLGEGEVIFVDAKIDEVRGTLGCKASVTPTADGVLYPGQFLTVSLVLGTEKGLLIPTDALHPQDGGFFVYLLEKNGRVSKRSVAVGVRDGRIAKLTQGPGPGSLVVAEKVATLDEVKVVPYKLVPAPAPAPGAASTRPAPLISESSVEAARISLRMMKKRVEAGETTRLRVLEAEQHLQWAEAMFAGDRAKAALANRDGAKSRLAELKQEFEAGGSDPAEIAAVERELAEAEAAVSESRAPTPPGQAGPASERGVNDPR